MNTREDDNEQYQWLIDRRRDAREGIRWLRLMVYGAIMVFGAALIADRVEAQNACEWNSDCITWPLPTKYVTGEALDPARIDSYRLETATAATGPWTTLATVKAPTRAYKRQPVSGTNYYRLVVILVSGVNSDPGVAGSSTVVEPKPESVPLLIAENIGYQINLGSNNKISLSRVAAVPIGKECSESVKFQDEFRTVYVIKDRNWAAMDPDPKKPGQLFVLPRQVLAKCERGV